MNIGHASEDIEENDVCSLKLVPPQAVLTLKSKTTLQKVYEFEENIDKCFIRSLYTSRVIYNLEYFMESLLNERWILNGIREIRPIPFSDEGVDVIIKFNDNIHTATIRFPVKGDYSLNIEKVEEGRLKGVAWKYCIKNVNMLMKELQEEVYSQWYNVDKNIDSWRIDDIFIYNDDIILHKILERFKKYLIVTNDNIIEGILLKEYGITSTKEFMENTDDDEITYPNFIKFLDNYLESQYYYRVSIIPDGAFFAIYSFTNTKGKDIPLFRGIYF